MFIIVLASLWSLAFSIRKWPFLFFLAWIVFTDSMIAACHSCFHCSGRTWFIPLFLAFQNHWWFGGRMCSLNVILWDKCEVFLTSQLSLFMWLWLLDLASTLPYCFCCHSRVWFSLYVKCGLYTFICEYFCCLRRWFEPALQLGMWLLNPPHHNTLPCAAYWRLHLVLCKTALLETET